MALQITDESFKELIAESKSFMVDFWAEWCGPCRMIGPIIDELANEYEGRVIIGKMNVDENDEIPGEYGIRSIPTILFFKNGLLTDRYVGVASKNTLEEKLKALI